MLENNVLWSESKPTGCLQRGWRRSTPQKPANQIGSRVWCHLRGARWTVFRRHFKCVVPRMSEKVHVASLPLLLAHCVLIFKDITASIGAARPAYVWPGPPQAVQHSTQDATIVNALVSPEATEHDSQPTDAVLRLMDEVLAGDPKQAMAILTQHASKLAGEPPNASVPSAQ